MKVWDHVNLIKGRRVFYFGDKTIVVIPDLSIESTGKQIWFSYGFAIKNDKDMQNYKLGREIAAGRAIIAYTQESGFKRNNGVVSSIAKLGDNLDLTDKEYQHLKEVLSKVEKEFKNE